MGGTMIGTACCRGDRDRELEREPATTTAGGWPTIPPGTRTCVGAVGGG